MSTTPTAALETLLSLPPIDLYIKAEARTAIHRLQILNLWKPNKVSTSHTTYKDLLFDSSTLDMTVDAMIPEMVFVDNITFEIPERRTHKETSRGLTWYTDGSKTSNGAGAGVYSKRPKIKYISCLGKHTSVFQAEIYALITCANINIAKGYKNKSIMIYTDSQAAIKSLENPKNPQQAC